MGIEGFQAQPLWLLGQEAGSLGERVRSGSRVRGRQGPPREVVVSGRRARAVPEFLRGLLCLFYQGPPPGPRGTVHGCCSLHN